MEVAWRTTCGRSWKVSTGNFRISLQSSTSRPISSDSSCRFVPFPSTIYVCLLSVPYCTSTHLDIKSSLYISIFACIWLSIYLSAYIYHVFISCICLPTICACLLLCPWVILLYNPLSTQLLIYLHLYIFQPDC